MLSLLNSTTSSGRSGPCHRISAVRLQSHVDPNLRMQLLLHILLFGTHGISVSVVVVVVVPVIAVVVVVVVVPVVAVVFLRVGDLPRVSGFLGDAAPVGVRS